MSPKMWLILLCFCHFLLLLVLPRGVRLKAFPLMIRVLISAWRRLKKNLIGVIFGFVNCGIIRRMRDICLVLGLMIIGLLSIILAVHIFICFDKGLNWFTTPLFNEFAHNAGYGTFVQTRRSLLWIA